MDVRYIKRSLKLAEWRKLIAAQVESGKPIDDWCHEQGLSRRMYFYWQRKIREEAIRNMPLNDTAITQSSEAGGSKPLYTPGSPAFARVEIKGPSAVLAISVRIGTIECEIYNGAETKIVESVLLTLGMI